MKHRNQSEGQRRCLSRLRRMLEDGEFLRASLIERQMVCGKPTCRCARGHKHRALYVGQSKNGKVRTTYVPPAWEARIRAWVEGRQQVDRLLEELSDLCWERLRQRQE